jgi:hypothetical protein
MSLRILKLATKDSGAPIVIPKAMTDEWVDQLVKAWIEVADYNGLDGSGTVALFRAHHGRAWTLKILKAIVGELGTPSLALELRRSREDLAPLFEDILRRHEISVNDTDWGYPSPLDKLPR